MTDRDPLALAAEAEEFLAGYRSPRGTPWWDDDFAPRSRALLAALAAAVREQQADYDRSRRDMWQQAVRLEQERDAARAQVDSMRDAAEAWADLVQRRPVAAAAGCDHPQAKGGVEIVKKWRPMTDRDVTIHTLSSKLADALTRAELAEHERNMAEQRIATLEAALRPFALSVGDDGERRGVPLYEDYIAARAAFDGEHRKVAVKKWAWGIFDTDQKRWWPRRFATREAAQEHCDYCKGSGSGARGEPKRIDEVR